MKKKMMIAALAFCVAAGVVTGTVQLGNNGVLEANAANTLKLSKEAAAKKAAKEASEEAETEEAAEEKDTDAQEEAISAEEATLTVSGTGSAAVTPDTAYLSLGVQTVDDSSKTAQDKNAKTINNVIDALLDAGVEEKNIKTSSFDLYANYDYSSDENELTGYTVTTTLTVKGLEISEVGELLEEVSDAGVNVVNGIGYEYSDSATAYDEALEAALERAQEKAQKLAGKEGCKLGKVISITENTDGYNTQDARLYAATEAASDSAMNVMAGEETISTSVTVVYQLSE